MKVVACYVRASTGGKNQAGQKREINRWLKSKRINAKTVRWYTEKSSTDVVTRRSFEKLRADISSGEVGTVVIWRLDRLSPTMRDGLNILCDWSKKPLRIVSVTQDIDFKGGAGKIVAALVAGIAEMDFETRRERTNVGVARARARGRVGGRPKITADDPKVIRAKKFHKDDKLSVREICRRLKISPTTYQRYLDL